MAVRRSRGLAVLAAVAGLCGLATTFLTPGKTAGAADTGRREALLAAAGAAAIFGAEDAQAFAEDAGPWLGYYADPQHPMCPREIIYDSDPSKETQLLIKGGDGNPGCEKKVLKRWRLPVKFKPGETSITIDFSKKGGPADVVGTWDGNGIKFPDGNKWKKLFGLSTASKQLVL
mmetsp:Transcript_56455/g.105859  ORF Transcript_56455/g.105859 Transcript_56455/m.105859 type:complete len:174 (-) Transcript_56455:180-701(-)